MLSDEEKEAIKELIEIKELSEEDLKFDDYEVTAILDKTDLKSLIIVLNLIENLIFKTETQKELLKYKTDKIEKQQKEIEELKKYEKGYKLLSYSLDNYISKDKIKAKIEELKKENEQNRKDLERAINFSIFNNIREKIFINMCIKDTLKSLLEKE